MQIKKASLFRIAVMTAALIMSYAMLLNFPQPLFPHSVKAANLVLHSDLPFAEDDGKRILRLAESKLKRSPLYQPGSTYNAYLCNARWRQMLLFNKNYGVAGVVLYPVSSNAFLRDANIRDNRLISPRGIAVPGDRTLDYFLAHELAHSLTGQFLGPVRFTTLPQWVREGYADYVGKGDAFHYDETKRAFLAGAPEMDWARSGLYLRFHLLVAHLLDRQHWSVSRLLLHPPPQSSVEEAIRAEKD